MISRKILYMIILAANIWLCMLYTFQGLRFLLGILLLLPIFCLFFLLLQVRSCRVAAENIPTTLTRGESIRLLVTVIHKGILPLAALGVEVKWFSYGAVPTKKKGYLRGMGSRCKRTIEYEFPAIHCGRAELIMAKTRIYDCLGLFSVPVKKAGKVSVGIMPVISELSEKEKAMIIGLLNRQYGMRDGDYFVRDYHPGDSPRSIHWKLTVRAEELQVKDFEADRFVKLFLNMNDELLKNLKHRDGFLDKACSVMAFFAEMAEEGLAVYWVCDSILQSCRIQTTDQLYFCISELIDIKKVGHAAEEETAPLRLGCHLEADGNLYIGEQCAYEE